jgi:hypothetical protein
MLDFFLPSSVESLEESPDVVEFGLRNAAEMSWGNGTGLAR